MKFTTRVRNAIEGFSGQKQNNDLSGRRMANDFLRNGNGKRLVQDWSQVEMSDADMYTGYSYAAIRKRANRASALGKKFLFTDSSDAIQEAAKKKGTEIEHPYLTLIRDSKEFSQRKFWHDISTYLDLEGVYYLMAVRAIGKNGDGTTKVGAVQKFVMMNPYEVRRVLKGSTNELGGYVEAHDGQYREIPKEMVIEIRLLNPFDNDLPYSMTDAAKESQFTLKQAGDYTRHSIQGNTNAPGAITTEVQLDDAVFDNFVSRIQSHTKGEPLYGNGAGAIKWESMQIDLDKAALDKINEIHRSILFAVSGTSKTALGIEESGTTRDTSKVQKDNFTEDAVMPQIEDIIDALNLDYRRNYPEWEKDKYEIVLDNPLETDREAELKDIEIRETEFDLTQKLVSMGYEYDLAAKYARGEIDVAELGEPTLEEAITPEQADAIAQKEAGFNPNPDAPSSEPQDQSQGTITKTGRPVPEQTSTAAGNSVGDRVTNKFVTKEENEKVLKEARARVKAQIKAQKDAEKAKKQAEKDEKKSRQEIDKLPVVLRPEADIEVVDPTAGNGLSVVKFSNQLAARDIPDLYDGLGIDFNKLGCIMLNTTKIPVAQYVKDAGNDIYDDGGLHTGVVGETEPHVTLLFGLLQNGNVWKDKVDSVLETWGCKTITINHVSFFDLGDSYAIVGLVEKSSELVDGHERLTLLPHINTFSEYIPHITLAYVVHDDTVRDKWVFALNKRYAGQMVQTRGINYGDLPETSEDSEGTNPKGSSLAENGHKNSEKPKKKKACQCCDGFGEHETGFECYRCDATGLESEASGPIPCDGREDSPNIIKDADGNYEHAQNTFSGFTGHSHSHESIKDDNYINESLERVKNALDDSYKDRVILGESDLMAATQRVEQDMVNAYILAVQNGDFNEARRILSESEERRFKNELSMGLLAFFTLLTPIYAQQLMRERANEFDKQGVFAMSNEIEKQIKEQANKGAESHVNTIKKDLDKAVDTAVANEIEKALIELVRQQADARDEAVLKKLPDNPNIEDITEAVQGGAFDTDNALYKKARQLAREGNGLDAVTRALRKEYENISKNRARTIARHETNRVFNMAQYQADLQFLKEANMLGDAYKILKNRANDPCPICNRLIEESQANPIPFQENFADLGDVIKADYTTKTGKQSSMTLPINYESISAGNVHVNCRCEYVLLIKQEDGTFLNTIDDVVKNGKGGNPNHDKLGRFTTGSGADGSLAAEAESVGTSEKVLSSLKEEAKKYKTLEAFKNSIPIVYHGSQSPLEHFNNDTGAWFTDDYNNADGYASGQNVYEGHLYFDNPVVINARGRKWDELDTKYGKSTQEIAGTVDRNKHDGVIINNVKDSWIDDSQAQTAGSVMYAFRPADSFLNDSQLEEVYSLVHPKNDIGDKVDNKGGGNPNHDKLGRFTTGDGGGAASAGLSKGKNTTVESKDDFERKLKERGVGDVKLSVDESVIKDGHGKAILETIDNIPESARNMIAQHKKKLSLTYENYPSEARKGRRYTRGIYTPATNSIRLFYDAKNPSLTSPERVKTTLTHELMHVADHGAHLFREKTGNYFREYVKVSKLPVNKRAPFIDSLTHAVKNVHEFYANTMTSYLTNSPTSKSSEFKSELKPIIEKHIAEYSA